tara:strand:- start:21795 stop:22583 length:789 start_codon:yes stop_codon:yes gene_type:complete
MKIKVGNKVFEVSDDVLKDNPSEIVIDEKVTIRTEEEESSFIENHKKDARKEGLEIAIKKTRDSLGLDFQGKTMDNLLASYESKVLSDAKIEPAEQLKKIQQTLQDKETALANALKTKEDIESNFNSYKSESKINNTLQSLIPKNSILPKDDMLLILKSKMSFDTDESGMVVAKDINGNIIKNKTTADVMDVKDVVNDFFRTNASYVSGTGTGTGDDSKTKEGKISLDDFIKDQQAKGISPNSHEFNTNLESSNKAGLIDLE